MYEINTDNIDSYEHRDSEYAVQLWSYVRRDLTAEEVHDIVSGDANVDGEGIEALENYSLHGKFLLGDDRPPTASFTSYQQAIERRLNDMPTRLAYRHWRGELESACSYDFRPFGVVTVLLAGEAVFEVDLTDEIVEELQHIDECETKLDMLEARGAISGDEWYERHEELENEPPEVTA